MQNQPLELKQHHSMFVHSLKTSKPWPKHIPQKDQHGLSIRSRVVLFISLVSEADYPTPPRVTAYISTAFLMHNFSGNVSERMVWSYGKKSATIILERWMDNICQDD